MRKISQALAFSSNREAHLTYGPTDEQKKQAEYDRLLHRRKGISGSEFAGVGLQFAVTIVVFALLGIWLDRKLGTSPWLLIVLALGGSGLGFWSLVRRVTRPNERTSTDKK